MAKDLFKFDFQIHVETESEGVFKHQIQSFLMDLMVLCDPDEIIMEDGTGAVVTWEVEDETPRPSALDVLSQARRTAHSGSQRPTSDEQNPAYRQAMMDSGRGHLLP